MTRMEFHDKGLGSVKFYYVIPIPWQLENQLSLKFQSLQFSSLCHKRWKLQHRTSWKTLNARRLVLFKSQVHAKIVSTPPKWLMTSATEGHMTTKTCTNIYILSPLWVEKFPKGMYVLTSQWFTLRASCWNIHSCIPWLDTCQFWRHRSSKLRCLWSISWIKSKMCPAEAE